MSQEHEIAAVLTTVIRATRHAAHKDYVASSCSTQRDFRAADEAEEAFNIAREEAIKSLANMVAQAQALGERTRPDTFATRVECTKEALTAMAHVYVTMRSEAEEASRKLYRVEFGSQEGRTLLFERNDAYARAFGVLAAAAAILGKPVGTGKEIELHLTGLVKP